jgi:hypothetical protein
MSLSWDTLLILVVAGLVKAHADEFVNNNFVATVPTYYSSLQAAILQTARDLCDLYLNY